MENFLEGIFWVLLQQNFPLETRSNESTNLLVNSFLSNFHVFVSTWTRLKALQTNLLLAIFDQSCDKYQPSQERTVPYWSCRIREHTTCSLQFHNYPNHRIMHPVWTVLAEPYRHAALAQICSQALGKWAKMGQALHISSTNMVLACTGFGCIGTLQASLWLDIWSLSFGSRNDHVQCTIFR